MKSIKDMIIIILIVLVTFTFIKNVATNVQFDIKERANQNAIILEDAEDIKIQKGERNIEIENLTFFSVGGKDFVSVLVSNLENTSFDCAFTVITTEARFIVDRTIMIDVGERKKVQIPIKHPTGKSKIEVSYSCNEIE